MEENHAKKTNKHGRKPREYKKILYIFPYLKIIVIFAHPIIKKTNDMARPIKHLPADTTKQSNYITTARYEYSPQEKRILYRVVEKAFEFRMQNAEYFKQHDGEYRVTKPVEFTMPIVSFIPGRRDLSGKDYEDVVDAFKALVDKRISFRGRGEFAFGGIVNYAFQNKGQGTVTFNVHQFVWQSALDFSIGFTKLDLLTAMQFRSAYTMRFYELGKKWIDKEYWICTMEEFREMFGCKDKYPNSADMKRYIIEVAKKELDKIGSLSFTYTQKKVGHNIQSFTFRFYNIFRGTKEEEQQLLSTAPSAAIPSDFKKWLQIKMDMSSDEIKHNVKLFYEFCQKFGNNTLTELEESFQYVAKIQKRPQENKGLFIQNLKKKLEWEKRQGELFEDNQGKEKIDDITSSLEKKFSTF